MTIVGNIGIGLLILLILWIITIIIFVVAVKLQSNLAWIALGIASAVTIILLSIPTEKQYNLAKSKPVEEDYIIIYKILILIFLIVSALAGLFIFFVNHCIESVRPKPFKSFYDN